MSPTLLIITIAFPSHITLPIYISSLIPLYFSTVSPVSELSSKYNSPSSITASPGTLPPLFKITMSFTTMSSIFTIVLLEFLITLILILLFSSLSLSNAFSLPYSDKAEINEAKNTDMAIPKVSYTFSS